MYLANDNKLQQMSNTKMFCWKCGTSVNKGDTFCYNCGSKLRQNVDKLETTDKPKKPIQQVPIEKMNQAKINLEDSGIGDIVIKLPRKEREAMYFGILAQIVWFVILILIQTEAIYVDSTTYVILSIWTVALRIIAVRWVRGIVRRKERNLVNWSVFAICSPTLALIIIGNLTYNRRTIYKLKREANQKGK